LGNEQVQGRNPPALFFQNFSILSMEVFAGSDILFFIVSGYVLLNDALKGTSIY